MDYLNTLSQCHFCTHLNTAFAPQCELCHELLSVHNMVLTTDIMHPPSTPRQCRHCRRSLLYNRRTCAYCNAHWSATPVSRLQALDNLHLDFVRLTVLPFLSSSTTSPALEPGLSPAARQQFLTRVAVDSACTTILCPVCIELVAATEDSAVEVVQLPCCRNKFHAACVQPWFLRHSSCPTCRNDLNAMALTN